jgi:hypothetical protein
MAYDVLLEEFLNCCGAYIGEWLRFHPLCEVFDCYNGKGVITLHWG